MSETETLREWVQGFEKEMQSRFSPAIRIIAVENGMELNMPLIAHVAAKCADVAYGQMFLSKKSKRSISDARLVAIYFIKKMITIPDKEVGKFFNRHRTSIRHANISAKNLIDIKDKTFTKLADDVYATLKTILSDAKSF